MKRADPIDEDASKDKFDQRDAAHYKVKEEIKRRREEEQERIRQRPNYLRRKFNRIFGGLGSTGGKFFLGFQQGFLVGAVIGLVSGTFMAVRTRRLSIFLLSPILSGASFGFFMGVGYIVRNGPQSLGPLSPLQPYLQDQAWIRRRFSKETNQI